MSEATIEFRAAVREAIDEEMARDERVVFFGEDVATAGGVFAVTPGLEERYGRERVFDTPISELAISAGAFGAAVTGLRPIFEIMFADFLPLAMDSLINQAAKYWYVSNEQGSVPLVVRSAMGAGGNFGAMHSQSPIPWLQGIPGLKVVAPATAPDAKALLKQSIRDENPVCFLEHKRLYSVKDPLGSEETLPLGRAAVVREGTDVTLVSVSKGVRDCLRAAEELAERGVEAEVLDLRSLRPLDLATVLASVAKTNRIVAVEEGPTVGGWAANLVGMVAAEGLGELDDAWVLACPETPIPYSPSLEDAYMPSEGRIVHQVSERLGLAAEIATGV
ncbi:MAG TPA: transketolase C-terminal domain-containing protein [Solirubrobacterales bacterium]|nr:transketolase C-terminal domain-containing protein [Solirubrobacterales bacterium]